MAIDEDKLKDDIKKRLDNKEINLNEEMVEQAIDNATTSGTSLSHEELVEYIFKALVDAHESDILRDEAYKSNEDEIIVAEEIPDLDEINNYK